MNTTPTPFGSRLRPPPGPLLLTLDTAHILHPDTPLPEAQTHLLAALDELEGRGVDGVDQERAARHHEAFVRVLHTARLRHPSVEAAVIGRLVEHLHHHANRHDHRHDHVVHALIASFAGASDPTAVALGLLEQAVAQSGPLPFWVPHALSLLPPGGSSMAADLAQRRARNLLLPRWDRLAPDPLRHTLDALSEDTTLHGLHDLIGDLGAIALDTGFATLLDQHPSAQATHAAPDSGAPWLMHRHPPVIRVGHTACDDHWLLTPVGDEAVQTLLGLCARVGQEAGSRLRHRILFALTHAAGLSLTGAGRRHPCMALVRLHHTVGALATAGDGDAWPLVWHWLPRRHTAWLDQQGRHHPRQAVLEALLAPSFAHHAPLALRALLGGGIDTDAWMPGLVRGALATPDGLERLVHALGQAHATTHANQAMAQALLLQCPLTDRLAAGQALAHAMLADERHPPHALTRDTLHGLARVQARFQAPWVTAAWLHALMARFERFGHTGLHRDDGEWLLGFVTAHAEGVSHALPPQPLMEALEGLFDLLMAVGVAHHEAHHACTRALGHHAPA